MGLKLKVASPCHESWERMQGDDRVRHCAECDLNVYNISAMTQAEAMELVSTHEGRLCGRLYRRPDGTVITKDCPTGARIVIKCRVSRIAGAALAASMSVGLAAAQNAKVKKTPIKTEAQQKAHGDISLVVTDSTGAVIPNAKVTVLNETTQERLQGVTDSAGKLTFPDVSPGRLSIIVENDGFETAHVDVKMKLHQSVEITVEAAEYVVMGTLVATTEELTTRPSSDRTPPHPTEHQQRPK